MSESVSEIERLSVSVSEIECELECEFEILTTTFQDEQQRSTDQRSDPLWPFHTRRRGGEEERERINGTCSSRNLHDRE